jgi:hypothetical protein
MLSVPASGERELEKVPVEILQRGAVLAAAHCRVTE